MIRIFFVVYKIISGTLKNQRAKYTGHFMVKLIRMCDYNVEAMKKSHEIKTLGFHLRVNCI